MQTQTPPTVDAAIARARSELASRGYTILEADALLSAIERNDIGTTLFAQDRLERDLVHVHPSRLRSDDLVQFVWDGEAVAMREAPANHPDPLRIYVDLTRNFSERRHYRRLMALDSPPLARLLEGVLHMVPREDRRPQGQLGIHVVTTDGVIVPGWHRDGNRKCPVDWVISYVVSRHGAGAVSQLATDRKGQHLIAACELAPGQLMMHRDEQFYHYVTPLEPTSAVPSIQRSAIIMMVRS